MKEFKFKCRGFDRTVYNAKLVGNKYSVTWEGMLNKVDYCKKDVESCIKDGRWVVINELIDAEDF